jgi:antitoxin HicB
MPHFLYPASLTPDTQDGGFVVTFPDVPEAITHGDDVPEALHQAADCLEEAIAGRIRRHAPIPEASSVGPDQYAIPLPAPTAAKAALYLALWQAKLTKVELAERLRCDEKEVRRLLDPRHASKLSRLESALAALGYQLVIGVQAGESPLRERCDRTRRRVRGGHQPHHNPACHRRTRSTPVDE